MWYVPKRRMFIVYDEKIHQELWPSWLKNEVKSSRVETRLFPISDAGSSQVRKIQRFIRDKELILLGQGKGCKIVVELAKKHKVLGTVLIPAHLSKESFKEKYRSKIKKNSPLNYTVFLKNEPHLGLKTGVFVDERKSLYSKKLMQVRLAIIMILAINNYRP